MTLNKLDRRVPYAKVIQIYGEIIFLALDVNRGKRGLSTYYLEDKQDAHKNLNLILYVPHWIQENIVVLRS